MWNYVLTNSLFSLGVFLVCEGGGGILLLASSVGKPCWFCLWNPFCQFFISPPSQPPLLPKVASPLTWVLSGLCFLPCPLQYMLLVGYIRT